MRYHILDLKYRILDLLRSPYVMALASIFMIGILFILVRARQEVPVEKEAPARLPLVKADDHSLKESPVTEISKNFTPWRPPVRPDKKPEAPVVPQPTPSEPLPKLIHDYEVAQKPPVRESPKAVVSSRSTIPLGSVIACRLLQSVQCGKEAVPVIAELLQPVRDTTGREWIPSGTRIHGNVHVGNLPGRLDAAGEWIFVLPRQKFYETKASLQNRSYDPVKRLYGVDDGTAGIAGTLIRPKQSGWKQTMVREGLQVAADASQDRMRTALGEVELGSARNAVLRGVSSVAGIILPKESPVTEETYVSVPAGKEFYLYISERMESPGGPPVSEMETLLRERTQLMQRLSQPVGKEAP